MALALLAVVGLAGMGLGFAADRLALRHQRSTMRRPGAPGGRGFGSVADERRGGPRRGEGMRERFARELDLSPEQQRRVDSIMAQQMEDFGRIRATMQPRFDSLLATGQARLDSVLTPAQREKLRTLRSREVFGPRDSFGAREWRPPPPPP
jgi:Spy/CpxP family protein refolding chaperone